MESKKPRLDWEQKSWKRGANGEKVGGARLISVVKFETPLLHFPLPKFGRSFSV